MAPLSYAVMCKKPDLALAAVYTLIDCGATVDYETNHSSNRPWGSVGSGESALWLAAQKTTNLKLIQILILKGAKVNQPLSDEAKKQVDVAMLELFKPVEHLYKWKSNLIPSPVPSEIIDLFLAAYLQAQSFVDCSAENKG